MKKFEIPIDELPQDVKERYDVLFNDIEKNKDLYDIDEEMNKDVSIISFEFTVKNGKVDPFDEDTHYGLVILSDEDSEYWVRTMMFLGSIKDDVPCGWVQFDDDKISIEY